MTVIDFRTFPVQVKELYDETPELNTAVREVFGFYVSPQPLSTFVHQLDEAGVDKAVVVPLDCTSAFGTKIVSNQQIGRICEQGDRFIGFASVDPNEDDASATLRKAVEEFGLRGLNLDPSLQLFDVTDANKTFPVYETCVDLDIPVAIQCGHNWAPKGRSGLSRPSSLEVVAESFPQLRIVVTNCGWPWVNEALSLCLKHPNVFLDTSVLFGGRPESSVARVLAEQIGIDVVEASLRRQILFASSYPRVDPKRMVRAIKLLTLRPVTERMILGLNAQTLLKKEGQS